MQAVCALIFYTTFVMAIHRVPASAAERAPENARRTASVPEIPFADIARRHWAFQPVKRVEPPTVKDLRWLKTPVDRFILASFEAKGIPPTPPASKEELIRRVTFDLIGLPPTLGEIDAFVKDSSSDASAHLIDRLLASPHYGERWGRHWLDVARFAETDGFEHDAVRPHAWRYRDYVIQSFNADKPYDRFIKEQLAGDELFPDEPEALIATAFNLLGPDMVDSADQIQRRLNRLNDMTDTSASAFLGLTMGCARCHDHKFEPISQKDYYRFQAFFTPAAFRDDLPAPRREELAAYQSVLKQFNQLTHKEQEEIAAIEAPYRRKLYERKLAKLSPEAQVAHKTPPSERTTEQVNQIQETAALVEVTEKEMVNAMSKEDRAHHKTAKEALAKFPKPTPLPMTMALQKATGNPAKTFILVRGDYNRPGDEVQTGFPSVLEGQGSESQISNFKSQIGHSDGKRTSASQRAALAGWIASPDNPLAARVMVNRIWQHHFGRGLVPTPSDFGLKGERPSHPELLDWLATEFITQGWSVKKMHQLLLLSAVYQQSSRATPESLARDPENRLYSRWQRKRLEGEVIRDSLLAIGGKLNRQIGGPGVFPTIPEDVFKGSRGWTVSPNAAEHNRRSIYIFARRNLRFPFLEVFDAPDSNLTCPERPRSTSAPQSLTLLNADEVLAASQATAARLLNEASSNRARVALAYRLILGRPPSEREQTLSRAFLEHAPLSELCRGLFNLNAFVYVD
ncbi:MAG: DUF1553 domain-containing protein [Verrucomicrobia bacterium]|nr:DUF1553 domain-containing protein [Verrucomicrobiota bacterium]